MSVFSTILDRVESRVSLADWAWRGAMLMIGFGVPAWAAHATVWLNQYGPITWVACGFAGLIIVGIVANLSAFALTKFRTIRMLKRLSERADAINPMDGHFHSKRINLQWFVPPSGDEVRDKTFIKCEIIGPLNVVPFGCSILKSMYVSADYIMVRNESLDGMIRNGHIFRNCTFVECRFYFISFLVSEAAYPVFNVTGGCNWITHIPVPPLALTSPPNVFDVPPTTESPTS